MPRDSSIDQQTKHSHSEREREERENLWDCITVLGAQLSRPSYDPYRESISLETSLGRNCNKKIVLSMPLLIYDNDTAVEKHSLQSLHTALNMLAVNNRTILGLVSESAAIKDRKYPLFQRIIDRPAEYDFEGLVLEYKDTDSIQILQNIRKEFDGPILVEIIDDAFREHTGQLLDAGADGIVIDTVKITVKGKLYKGKHAIAIIHDARCVINQHYKGKDNDGAMLVVAGDVNNVGKIIKAAALGADIIGYSTSLLIANAENNQSEKHSDIKTTAKRIYQHILGTKGELKGIPAAMGYSNFNNMSPSDLRTSNIDASLQADINIEGIDTTYKNIVEKVLDEYLVSKGLKIVDNEKQQLLRSIAGR
jgi:hypothetical protein